MSGYAFVDDDAEVKPTFLCYECDDEVVENKKDTCKRCIRISKKIDQERTERANTIQFGKYKGKTFSWIVENDMGYAKWLLKKQEERHFDFSPRGLPDWMFEQNCERERISDILTKLGVKV
jgi:hypothetical protein